MMSEQSRNPLGRCYITEGVLNALQKSNQEPGKFLRRHANGDRGKLSGDAEDKHPAVGGGRVVSVYETSSGEEIWAITEKSGFTALLLPNEY